MYIDHSGPELDVWGLRGRWDTDGLYVHNSTDLSTMRLMVSARDDHSGLYTFKWKLGSRPLSGDVGQDTVAIQRHVNMVSFSQVASKIGPRSVPIGLMWAIKW